MRKCPECGNNLVMVASGTDYSTDPPTKFDILACPTCGKRVRRDQ